MIGLGLWFALLALVALCLWGWCAADIRLDRMRGERDALLQMTNQAPDEDDVVLAMMMHRAFGAREGPARS